MPPLFSRSYLYLDKKKIHDPQNQHLRFNLEIRRHDDILPISTSSSVQSGKNGDVEERIYNVCVPYLCQILANAALDYYKKNKEKFYFSCNIIYHLHVKNCIGVDKPTHHSDRANLHPMNLFYFFRTFQYDPDTNQYICS